MKVSYRFVQIFGLILVTLLGVLLRFKGLNYREFWYDEAYTGLTIARNWSEMYALLLRDIHPPLYYILIKVWADIFGHTDFVIRSLSFVFGTLLIPASFIFVRRVVNYSKGFIPLFVSFVIAVNPFLIAYSQEARAYSLLAFLFLMAAYFFYFGLTKSPLKFNLDWLLFSILVSLLFLTHYISFFGIISFFIFMAAYYTKVKTFYKNGAFCKSKLKVANLIAMVLVIPVVVFSIWLPSFRIQRFYISNLGLTWGWIPKPEFSFIPKSLYAFLFGVERQAIGVPKVVEITPILSSDSLAFILFSVILGVSIYIIFKKRDKKEVFLPFVLTLWVLPIFFTIFASFFGYNIYVERYLIGYGVFFLIYLGLILSKFKKRKAYVLLVTAGFYMVIASTISVSYANLGYRKLAVELQSAKGKIIFNNPFEFVVARYYLGKSFDSKIRIYDFASKDKYQGWALIENDQVLKSLWQIKNEDILVTTNPPKNIDYKLSKKIEGFKIYENLTFSP